MRRLHPDVLCLLNYLLASGPDARCRDAADSNEDGELDLSDAIRVLLQLFARRLQLFAGRAFDPPLGVCAADATPDDLDCRSLRVCGDGVPG
ncbi:MAG: hypothetical protein ACUVYA_03515 [Planctomycetota bacterium]